MRAERFVSRRTAPWLRGGVVAQYWSRYEPNLGDALSPVFMSELLQVEPRWVTKEFAGKLLGMGSVARHVRRGDIVAGSGAITADAIHLPKGVTVRWVRGPLTRRCLGESRVPDLYGDPGMFLSEVLEGLPAMPASPGITAGLVGVIPHFVDRSLQEAARFEEDTVELNVLGSILDFVANLKRCEAVVSSSLHGIVFAEALGIPAVWVTPAPGMKGGRFKFDDYFLGTGREGVQPLGVPEALEKARSGSMKPWVADLGPLRAAVQELRGDVAI